MFVFGIAALSAKPILYAFALAKIDTNKVLQTVKVSGTRYPQFFTGSKILFLDSSQLNPFQQQSIAGVLAFKSPVFIKSYGPGMLATPSFRGGNANHTAIIWNGFNLQNPMSGQVDLNNIPSFLIDNIDIQFGSQSVLFGSGNIGGTVHLNSQANKQIGQHVNILLGNGSFGSNMVGIKYGLARTKWQMEQKIFLEKAANNFSYKAMDALYPQATQATNPKTLPTLYAVNAQRNNVVWVQELAYQISGKHTINFRTWLQNHERNIPPSLHGPLLNAQQKDESAKALFEYTFKQKSYELQARYAYFIDALSFKNKQVEESYSLANSHTAFIDQFYIKDKFQWHGSAMFQQNQAQLRGAANVWQQDKIALFSSIKLQHFDQKLKQQISARQEWVNGVAIPLMPAYGFSYQFLPKMHLDGNVSRNYRLPTFNDLYWPGMGNPDLQAEFGWNQELSLHAHHVINFKGWRGNYSGKRAFLSGNITYFNKQVNNWIIWVPAGGNLSTPMNVYRVWSRGVEMAWQIRFRNNKKSEFVVGGMHDYTQTSNQASTLLNDASLNKQLIYTPRVKHQMQVQFLRGDYAFQYLYNYIGTRFVSSDHSNWLMPYSLHGINLSKKWHWFSKNWQTQILVNNFFNTSYQIMVNQPMPLVNYQLSLNIKL
ncbi:MAG: TonB-dependent receptor [Bacteroidota bacterium]|nr:TonB-dependent receptor [Bacteroidota bacterium]